MVAIQVIMALAFSIMMPFLPLYLVQMGVHPLGTVEVWSGILSSVNFLVGALVSPYWGRLADRHGRKIMILRSALAVSLFTGLMGLAGNVWELFALRILMGAFAGFSAASIALVGTEVPDDQLGYALGWLQSGLLLGTVAGPLIGGFLASILHSYKVVFFATSALAVVATLAVYFQVKESFVPNPQAVGRRQGPLRVFSPGELSVPVVALLIALLMAQFSTRTIAPVVTLFVRQLAGNTPHLATLAGVAFSVTGLGDFVGSPFLGKRSDQIGYRKVLLITLLGSGLMFIPQYFVHNIWVFILLRFGLGLFIGGIIPTANAMIGHMTPPEKRGTIYGATASATFLGNFAGPLVGGTLAAWLSIRATFLVAAVLTAITWAWVYMRVPEVKNDERDLAT